MSAENPVHTYNPYADRAKSGPIDFAGDAPASAAASALPVRRPSLLLRALLAATVLLAAATSFAAVAPSPKAHLSGTNFQQTIGSGFVQPEQMAIDVNGNLYIADVQTNEVYKETLGNGVYTQSILRANLNGPIGVAVDGNGDVFIANSDSSQVLEEVLRPDGSYIEEVVTTSGLGGIVCDLAASKTGTAVYIADCFNNRVVVETLTRDQWAQSVVPATGLLFPNGVALSPSGQLLFISDGDDNRIVEVNLVTNKQTVAVSTGLNAPTQVFAIGTGTPTLYIADTLNSRIVKATYDSVTKAYNTSTVPTGKLNAPTGVVADKYGDVFIADTNDKQVVEDVPGSSTNFGPWPIGETSTTATLTFTFDVGGTLKSPSVYTNTGVNYPAKFANLTTSTCKYKATFATGESCTIDVTFAPYQPGLSFGTVELVDSAGSVLAQVEVSGVGVGPKAIFPSNPSDSLIGTHMNDPRAVAVDQIGNVYIADTTNNQVLQETVGLSGYTQSVIAKSGGTPSLKHPTSIAVDSIGNVFVTNSVLVGTGTDSVLEFSPGSTKTSPYTQSTVCQAGNSTTQVPSCPDSPIALVVDGQDNLWVANLGLLQEFTWSSSKAAWVKEDQIGVGAAIETSSGTKFVPLNITSLAVDGAGNFYMGAAANSTAHTGPQILEYALQTNGSRLQSTIVQGVAPVAIAVDTIGNVFYGGGTGNNSGVYVFSPGQIADSGTKLGTQTQLSSPAGIAVDATDTLYIANSGVNQVLAETWSDGPSFAFPTTQVDSTSSAITHSFLNIGNEAFDWTIPSTGQNPSVTSGFLVNTGEAGACPVLTSSSEPDPLLPGSGCALSVSFSPTKTGHASGNVTYGYNLAGTDNGAFGFQVAGNAIQPVPVITWPTPAPINYGTPLSATQLNATAAYNGQTVPGTFSYSPALGAIPGGGTQTLHVQFTPSVSGYSSASATVQIQVTPAPLIVVADSFSQTYGSPIPTFTASYIGFVNGDTPASLTGAPAITTEATQQYPWGYYPITITQGNLQSTSYTITFVDGTLVITQATLTVTADDQTIAQGQPIPALSYEITGFVNNDTGLVVSGDGNISTTATSSSPPGTYPITVTQGTLTALNYNFTFVAGTLTISESQVQPVKHRPAAGRTRAVAAEQVNKADLAVRKRK